VGVSMPVIVLLAAYVELAQPATRKVRSPIPTYPRIFTPTLTTSRTS
jgi:hypothetical protein